MAGFKQTFSAKLTDYGTTQYDPLGSIRFEDGKFYKYVQIKNTTSTVAGAAGSVVAYGAAGGYDSNLVVVDLTDADANPIPAGALLGVVAGVAGTVYYGYVQIKGRATLDTAVTSGAIGEGFTLTTTDKTCTVAVAGDVKPYAGVSVDATTGVLLDCPF